MPARVSRLLISAAFVGLFALSNSAEHLPVRVYTTADGLCSSAVHEIVRDSRGFLWFATRDGLSRFDGQRFVNYRLPADASPNIVQILARSNGDYFVMPQGGGVYRFNAATTVSNENVGGSAILNAEKISENPFGRLYEDRSGRLWASGRDLTLLEEIDGKFVLHPVPLELPNGRRLDPSRVLQAVDGGFWLTTNDGLLHLAPDLRILEFYETPPNSQIYEYLTALFEDSNGRIWVGTPDAVLIIKPRNLNEISHFVSRPLAANKRQKAVELPQKEGETVSFTVAASLNGGIPRGFSQTADGRVFITTDSGLTVFDGREFRSFSRVNGLGRPLTLSTLDTNGDLWMAGTSGAYKLAADGFTTFGIQDGLGDNIIDAIYEGADGKIYVANGRWNVSRFEERNFATVQPYLGANLKNPLWTSNVSFPDREGSWWFLAEKKMFRFDSIHRLEDLKTRGPSAVFESNADFFNGAFYRLFEDSRGDVWLSIRSGLREQMGLRRWNRATGDFQTFTEREGYPPASSPSAFAEDSNGNLWLGFYWGGIARFNNEHFDIFSNDAGVPKGGVFSLHFDKAGRLWIATSEGGLGLIENPSADIPIVKSITVADGLSSNNARAITEDESGEIYVGTVRGVDRISPTTGKIRRFTTTDGLANEFVTTAFRDRNGTLWFGTRNGLSRLVPKPAKTTTPPPIFIAGLRIAGVKQTVSELGQPDVAALDLDYTQSNLQIDFLSIGDNMRYQYRLEGADKEWSQPTSERTVNFSNIAPGNYTFQVRAVGSSGLSSEKAAVVSFSVSPPFWRTWTFVTSMLLLCGAFVVWYNRRLTKRRRERLATADALARATSERLRELEHVRRRIATDLHDDIGSSLTQISILSEVLRQRVDPSQPSVTGPLTMIADSSRELVDSMSDIVWSINPQKDKLQDLIQRMRRFASDIFTARSIEFLFNAPTAEVAIGANVRREIFLIYKEAIHNIVKHAGCSFVEIGLRVDNAMLTLTVRDNGCGFDLADSNGQGHGLSSIRERVTGIGGRGEISSDNGGTCVTVVVPLAGKDGNL